MKVEDWVDRLAEAGELRTYRETAEFLADLLGMGRTNTVEKAEQWIRKFEADTLQRARQLQRATLADYHLSADAKHWHVRRNGYEFPVATFDTHAEAALWLEKLRCST